MVGEGTFRLGPDSGRLLVKTSRSGLGARAGHDLVIEAAEWTGNVVVGPDGSARVHVEVNAGSLTIRDALGGLKPMTSSDRKMTEKNMVKVLQPGKYPVITFTADSTAQVDDAVSAPGTLTLVGKTQPLTVSGTVSPGGRLHASATVTQSRWGITPFSAFFGALRLADDVAVEVDAGLSAAD
ncbi:YceI family protein [Hoyosella altamirensis]|uniref:Polyisoprenoid-binding protein YceI n=1 Tax=Hoyosella altamirensis TaxID=616997 RepID=A0A839RJJ4_9ACTN|nr:YceI family protein [Hoyosella altamirensis]MBB3036344.1 polyisoprenoid-binding protein YceI [Hoyosella altamirensis]